MSLRNNPIPIMKTYTLVRTYTLMLDMMILSLLVLAVYFNITEHSITDSFTSRSGNTRTLTVTWQSLLFVASFCVFLRYIARNVR